MMMLFISQLSEWYKKEMCCYPVAIWLSNQKNNNDRMHSHFTGRLELELFVESFDEKQSVGAGHPKNKGIKERC